MTIFKKSTFLLCSLLFVTIVAGAKKVRVDYIGENPLRNGIPVKDTLPYLDILHKLYWDVTYIDAAGKEQKVTTTIPDTLVLGGQSPVRLTTLFEINPVIKNRVLSLGYNVKGSLSVKLNGEPILNTGRFVTDQKDEMHLLKQDNLKNFLFRDTLEQMELTYVPPVGSNYLRMGLILYEARGAADVIAEKKRDSNESYALGFYYLAFFVIFIILFIFFRVKTENLYFSLFCLFASLAFLWKNFNLDILEGFNIYMVVIAMELLSIFFARIIQNVEKSKVPLIMLIVLIAVTYIPFFATYSFIVSGVPLPIFRILVTLVLYGYTGISILYYLIQGIGQKSWEARMIVILVSVAFILFLLVPVLIRAYYYQATEWQQTSLHYLMNIGLCIYPLSAAIVLGRRNGLNQKQLIKQVVSIEKLSEENLVKEKEKQLLLENQNTELEKKVAERTTEVQRQKELIELKNKAITDNINYAQRIQSAILPDIKLIYKALEQSFILFQPKDIVSGDFYAFAERNSRVLIIAGDCTGHGVSGAFMSMIGSSLLNQIINERGIDQPALILNQLNSSVIESLKQSVNESNDGMDVSICSFDLARTELQYAGANRPLWLVRDKEVMIFRPDKFPIGGLQMARDRTFNNFTIPLQKKDTIYIFTDGYADQFGGENGKKMMTAKFKEILLSIQGLNMREQEKYLKEYFDTWKGKNEQVDDVLVIGVRV